MARRSSRPGQVERAPRLRTKSRSAPVTEDVLGRFSDALSLLSVAQCSLASKELRGTGDEEVALRHALGALREVYTDLDRAAISVPPGPGDSR